MKLAIAQIVLGALILVDCIGFVIFVSPVFLFAVPAFGLAVLGCGIAQYLRAGGLKGGALNKLQGV